MVEIDKQKTSDTLKIFDFVNTSCHTVYMNSTTSDTKPKQDYIFY
jgi:hypothetical protein